MTDVKRYYWMKFQRDFFKSLRIRKLRRLAGGDTYTIIYLKLQLLSLTTEGYLEYKGVFESFAEEMAEELDESEDNVALTIQYLLASGLMEQDGDTYFLPYVADNIGSETANALRIRECRKRKNISNEMPCISNEIDVKQTRNVEIEKEKDIEIEKNIYQQIADMYNSICKSYPKVVSLSNARKKAIKARLNDYSVDDFKRMFEKAEESRFLKGGNDRNWQATFDWLIKDSNMAKVLDGNYDSKNSKKAGFNTIQKNDYDFDSLERALTGE